MALNINESLQDALTAHHEGKYETAIACYKKIIDSKPRHLEALNNLGVIFHQIGKFQEAITSFKKVIIIEPEYAEAHYNLGKLLQKMGKYNEAIECYKKATILKPNLSVAFNNLGSLLYMCGNLIESEANFKKAIELNPNFSKSYHGLAVTLQEIGRIDEALICFKKAIEIDPDNSIHYFGLGSVLTALGKKDQAEINFTKAIKLNPNFAEAYLNLGVIKQIDKIFDEAEINYKKAIELKPDYAEAYNNYAHILQERGAVTEFQEGKLEEAEHLYNHRTKHAEINYKKAIQLRPDYVEAYYNLAILMMQFEKFDKAEENYKKAIKLKPDYAEAHNNLGVILKNLGKIDEALECYKKAIELKPDFNEAYNNLGGLLHDLDKSDEALECYKKAIEIKPDFLEAINARGGLLFYKKEFELSLKDFDLCNTIDSRFRALSSLYALGRTKEIYERIEKNSELDSESIKIAAFSSFISHKEKKVTAHKFCNNPIDFISTSNLSTYLENSNSFIAELIDELKNIKTRWEPIDKATTNGSQSTSNLFENSSGKIKDLRSIIIAELASYYLKFKDEPCTYIKKWPSKKILVGWHVILKQKGYQSPHIHPGGWLSGVIYLKTVPILNNNEGAIELSLNGNLYSDLNSPKVIHKPKVGDIILFPSSLHHKTIPFMANEDRISIAFDLMPSVLKFVN